MTDGGALVAIAGVFAITFQPGDLLRLGSLMVLASTLMYALHAALVKRYGAQIDFSTFFSFRLMATTGFLVLFAVARRDLVWPDLQAWLLLALVGTVDVVISRGLYYLALRRLQMSIHSIILTLSPVVTVLWSLFLFGSIPTPQELAGGLTVIAGILMLSASRAQVARAPSSSPKPRP